MSCLFGIMKLLSSVAEHLHPMLLAKYCCTYGTYTKLFGYSMIANTRTMRYRFPGCALMLRGSRCLLDRFMNITVGESDGTQKVFHCTGQLKVELCNS